ncbi:adenosine receptor A3-like [Stylophora pistillata]|uniref:adenosine receptor A3-like n=1 Tax=Stylophora pistillata TaxID=50429 RepID=UPI000C041847|nr:adenosine receptor A3-like [Stylophora pistillata]
MWSSNSAWQCIPWLVILITECLVIVILNIITIVVFMKKKRQLQRRSTYLIIHLAIVDLLVGAVSGPLHIEVSMSWLCPLWEYRRETIWSHRSSFAFVHVFSFTSLLNLVFISLERLHATFFPFRHRFIKKCVYKVMITVIWLTTIAREAAQIFLKEILIAPSDEINVYLYLLFYVVSVSVICVSCILIVIKVRCTRHPQYHSRSKRERKLTGTSLFVSLVSLVCFLPAITYIAYLLLSSSLRNFHISMAVLVLFLGNSLVNPIIYALRMPGFREGLLQIVCRVSDVSNTPVNLPLRNLRRT